MKRQRKNQDMRPFHETSKENESYHGHQASPLSQDTIRKYMSANNELNAVDVSELLAGLIPGTTRRRDQKINSGPDNPGYMYQCNITWNTEGMVHGHAGA